MDTTETVTAAVEAAMAAAARVTAVLTAPSYVVDFRSGTLGADGSGEGVGEFVQVALDA